MTRFYDLRLQREVHGLQCRAFKELFRKLGILERRDAVESAVLVSVVRSQGPAGQEGTKAEEGKKLTSLWDFPTEMIFSGGIFSASQISKDNFDTVILDFEHILLQNSGKCLCS